MVGIYGLANWSNTDIFSKYDILDIGINSLYHGMDWIYTFTENVFMYDFNINYSWFVNNIFQDNFDFNYYSYWYTVLDISNFTILWSVILDKIILTYLIKFDLFDAFFKNIVFNYDFSLVVFMNPEFYFISNVFMKTFILPFSSDINSILHTLMNVDNLFNPAIIIPHLGSILLIIGLFISIYFSYYTSSVREENTIDQDYLIANATVEAEEEIGSVDDIMLTVVIIGFIFLWYFGIHFWFILNSAPELVMSFYLFPFLYYIILVIPVSLAYDFGLFFVAYLRGVGGSPVIFVELMYDYIMFSAFYIRLIVQNVRLILMTFTFAAFHEVVIFHGIEKEWIIGNETFTDEINHLIKTPSYLTYFLVFKLSGHIIYFFYELFHTLFVVTAQFIAFFAMVFWLFLFLYTMFTAELQEKFFNIKRLARKKLSEKYSIFKQNINKIK